MTDTLMLHYAPDNASLCVRLALEALELPFETQLVDRRVTQQRSEAYLALNPNGRIPTLETPNGVMFETAAILLWLADQHPEQIFPAVESKERGQALTWLFWVSNTLHPCLLRVFYSDRYGDAKATRAAAKSELFTLLEMLDARWAEARTPLLECYVAPILRWTAIYGGRPGWFDLVKFPQLKSLATRFEAQEFAGRAAMAEGLGPTPFSNPSLPNPPEGSAL